MSSRVWAAVLDFIACYLLFTVAAFVLVVAGVSNPYFEITGPILLVAIPWLYFAGFESSAARATPGKREAQLVVTDAQGARISFARASLRFLGKAVLLATCGLGLLTLFFDRQRRALDDFVADTRVHDVGAVSPRPLWKKAIVPVLLVGSIGLLAKIAIDAQNDFRQRASNAELLYQVSEQLQAPYVAYYQENQHVPKTGELVFKHPKIRDFEVDASGMLVLRLNSPDGAVLRLTPVFSKDGTATWTCRVEADHPGWFPSNCRSK